jgi:putative transposase
MTDLWSKEVPVIEVDNSIGEERVCRILDRLLTGRPLPETVIVDNGPEFAGTALDAWASQHGVRLPFIQPGKPVQNAFIESVNGKFRDECLNEHWFLKLQKAQVVIETWRQEYNEERTHSAIVEATPMEFIQYHQDRPMPHRNQLRWPWCNKGGKVTVACRAPFGVVSQKQYSASPNLSGAVQAGNRSTIRASYDHVFDLVRFLPDTR